MANAQASAPIIPSHPSFAFTVVCGDTGIAADVTHFLEQQGLVATSDAALTLLIDLPLGFAMTFLHQNAGIMHRIVVRTWNTCLAYHADIWDLQPASLLTGESVDLAFALRHAGEDVLPNIQEYAQRYGITPVVNIGPLP